MEVDGNQNRGPRVPRSRRGFKRNREIEFFQDPSFRLRAFIIRIGDAGEAYVQEEIRNLSEIIRRELPQHGSWIAPLLFASSIDQQPAKLSIYATIVGVVNVKVPEFGASIVQQAQDVFTDGLEVGQRPEAKSILRFLACLVKTNVIAQVEMVRMLQMLVDQASLCFHPDEADPWASLWLPKADFMVHCVLIALIWLASGCESAACPELESLVNSISQFMEKRSSTIPDSLRVFGYDKNMQEKEVDYLNCMWSAVSAVHSAGSWKSLAHLHKFSSSFEEQLAASTNQHTFSCTPQIFVGLDADSNDVICAKVSSMFTPRKRVLLLAKELTGGERPPIERIIAEEYVVDTLHFYNSIRKECSERLARLPLGFRHEAFLAEMMFGQMLQLPTSDHKPIFYYATMIDLCKLLPEFPRAMVGCVRELFGKLDALDVECRLRLSEWLAYHLSNFNFQWPWERWAHVLDQPDTSMQRIFLADIIGRLVRLSYHEKIEKCLPEAFLCLLPPRPVPVCMYLKETEMQDGEDPLVVSALHFHSMVRERRTEEDVNQWLQESVIGSAGTAKTLDMVLQVLLMLGSKSFTHTITALERYLSVLQALIPDEDHHIVAINSVSFVWTNSPQRTIMILNRLHSLRLVHGVSLINWAFTRTDLFLKEHLWEIVFNACSKEIARAQDANAELSDAQNTLPPDEEGMGKEAHESTIQHLEVAVSEAREKEKQTLLCLFENFRRVLDSAIQDGEGRSPSTVYLLQHLRMLGRRFRLSAAPYADILRSMFASSDELVRKEAFSGLFCTE